VNDGELVPFPIDDEREVSGSAMLSCAVFFWILILYGLRSTLIYYKGRVSASETKAHLLFQDHMGNTRRIPVLEAQNASLKRESETPCYQEKLVDCQRRAWWPAISAYPPAHHSMLPFLLQLLEDDQQHCRQLRRNTSNDSSNYSNGHSLAVVHAYADGPYDRSSFHVAGSPCLVADLASQSATLVVQSLSSLRHEEVSGSTTDTPHPTVGLVDHVAVLPLAHNNEPLTAEESIEASDGLLSIDIISKNKGNIVPSRTVASGWVARAIGHGVESKAGAGVFFYGHATAQQTPFATVRGQESTQLFQSLPTISSNTLHNEMETRGGLLL
jgi:hypothetical protein